MLSFKDLEWIGNSNIPIPAGNDISAYRMASDQVTYLNTVSAYRNVDIISKDREFYICSNYDNPVGVVRYDKKNKQWIFQPASISITTNELCCIHRLFDAIDAMGGLNKEWIFPK